MKKKLVYVAHPYGGKESNRKKIDVIMGDLVLNDASHDYISPIHNFGKELFSHYERFIYFAKLLWVNEC